MLETVLVELPVVYCSYLWLTASSIFVWELKWNLDVDMVLIRKEIGRNMLGDKNLFRWESGFYHGQIVKDAFYWKIHFYAIPLPLTREKVN